jgi:hypothetical protein
MRNGIGKAHYGIEALIPAWGACAIGQDGEPQARASAADAQALTDGTGFWYGTGVLAGKLAARFAHVTGSTPMTAGLVLGATERVALSCHSVI